LSDAIGDFVTQGVRANVGMRLYNVTLGTYGPVTAVTTTTITATGVIWNTGNVYRMVLLDNAERATIENYLDITATDIHMVLASTGACDCTLASWAAQLLAKLNIVEAGVMHQCPCGRPDLTIEERRMYMEFFNNQMELLRTGKLDVCEGATGADFPSLDWAEQAINEFSAARIVENDILRNS